MRKPFSSMIEMRISPPFENCRGKSCKSIPGTYMTTTVDLSLFPHSSLIAANGSLTIAGHDLEQLASRHATPLYLYDGLTVRTQIERLNSLLHRYYPGESMLAYASKAYFSLSFARRLNTLGIGVDVVSLGEIRAANLAGFAPESVHLHGNNKSDAELQAAGAFRLLWWTTWINWTGWNCYAPNTKKNAVSGCASPQILRSIRTRTSKLPTSIQNSVCTSPTGKPPLPCGAR